MRQVVGRVSFPNLTVNAQKLEYYCCDSPRTDFDIIKENGKYEIRYNEADVGFTGDSIQEIVDQIREFLNIDEIVVSVGSAVIKLVD